MRSRVASIGLVGFVMAIALTMASASATVCVNVSKADGAGNIGDVIVHLDGSLTIPTNAGGQLAGGFVDVYIEFDANSDGTADGMFKALDDTFILDVKRRLAAGLPLPELPEGAHLAAGCGQAVDDAFTCSTP